MRFHNVEDNDKRTRNEMTKLKREMQDILRENEISVRELNVRFILVNFINYFHLYRNGDVNMK